MGTRNLVAVVLDGKHRIAQYGQWDGYPSGQGEIVSSFIRNKMDLGKFKEAVRNCRYLSAAEMEALGPNWLETHGHLSRDIGGKILELVQDGKSELKDSWDFAADSLFCEYAYVLDLDDENLEVYKGFTKEPVDPQQRFADLSLEKPDGEYKHVRLIKKYKFSEIAPETMANLETEMSGPEED